eukprot:754851-Hanusia_phi.AAC.2
MISCRLLSSIALGASSHLLDVLLLKTGVIRSLAHRISCKTSPGTSLSSLLSPPPPSVFPSIPPCPRLNPPSPSLPTDLLLPSRSTALFSRLVSARLSSSQAGHPRPPLRLLAGHLQLRPQTAVVHGTAQPSLPRAHVILLLPPSARLLLLLLQPRRGTLPSSPSLTNFLHTERLSGSDPLARGLEVRGGRDVAGAGELWSSAPASVQPAPELPEQQKPASENDEKDSHPLHEIA